MQDIHAGVIFHSVFMDRCEEQTLANMQQELDDVRRKAGIGIGIATGLEKLLDEANSRASDARDQVTAATVAQNREMALMRKAEASV